MTTVTRTSTKVQHFASLLIGGEEVYGVATLVQGGYSFRPDRVFMTRVVSYADPALMLYGLVSLADAALADDTRVGGSRLRTLYEAGGAGTDDAPDMQRW